MHLRNYVSISISIFLLSSAFSQQRNYPFTKPNMNSVCAVRGKIFFLPVSRTRVATGTAGLEYRFLKDHSLGADAIYTWFKTPVYYWDPVLDEQVEGPSKYIDMFDLHLDYRYYLSLHSLTRRGIFPYINAFTMQGSRRTYFEAPYADSYEKQHEYLGRYGISTGCLWGFGPLKRFGIDLNLGCMYTDQLVHRYDYNVHTITDLVRYTDSKWGVNVRINAYYYLFRGNLRDVQN